MSTPHIDPTTGHEALANPITVSFCLSKCERHELFALRDLFRGREARCLHLSGAVPVEYVAGIEAEASRHGATARKVEDEIARQDHLEATRRASMQARTDARRLADALRRNQMQVSG